MTVDRHEFRNRKTMSTVSAAPSMSVCVHRDADGARVVAVDLDLHAGRHQRRHVLEGGLQAVDHGDGVLALRLLHRQQHRALAVVEREALDLLRAVDHVGHLPELDGVAAAAGHHDVAEVFRPLEARIDLHHALLLGRLQGAHRQLLVLAPHGGEHLIDAHAHRFERGRAQVEVDLALDAAHHRDRAHAAHVFQALLQHLRGPGRELLRRLLVVGRQHRHVEDRRALRVEAEDARLLHLVAQVGADERDLLAHVVGGLAAIDVEVELDDHDRRAFIRARREGVDAGDGVDGLFDLLADLGFDDLGRGAGVVHLDHDGREVDVGELVDREPLHAEEAQHHEGQHDHRGHHRVADGNAREPHGGASLSGRRLRPPATRW
jgi:hypothetical protein